MMPEQQDCDLLQAKSQCDSKKKKNKKRRKNTASISPPEYTRQDMMLEQHDRDPLHDTKKKKKKKKRKGNTAAISPLEKTRQEKPHTMPVHPENLPVSGLSLQSAAQPRGPLPKLTAAGRKGGEQPAGSGTRSKTHPKTTSPAPLTAESKESLRWEGVLDDPVAEAERMEVYRANRRKRYYAQMEKELKESQDALRPTSPK